MPRRRFRTLLLLALMGLSGAAFAQERPGGKPGVVPMPSVRWHAVLAAGDGSLPVWDNAVQRLVAGLDSAGALAAPPRRLTSSGKQRDLPLATSDAVLRAVAALRPGAGEGCLVFVTSHGIPQEGLSMTASPTRPLTPRALDAALARGGCAEAPTLVIISGCYSGDFARLLARPNRAVMTASRADRPSFGCGAGFRFTVFDECLLDALEARPALWTEAVARTRSCVTARERQMNVEPSEPQASLGHGVAGLRAPLSR
ncbi:MAG TPA: C13 family peptidase [Acetobacteraceae bacterium]|nr:C13 family peptidase [Acetobacteraceae bacterium]